MEKRVRRYYMIFSDSNNTEPNCDEPSSVRRKSPSPLQDKTLCSLFPAYDTQKML